MTTKLNDNSPMPNGKYKGILMANVPDEHLLWIYENNKCRDDVREYIEDNLQVLKTRLKSIPPVIGFNKYR